jgi:broad specificity phosphatase PhoE
VPPRTILTLVRHGETSANIDGVWHGSTDTPLTERGLQQAARVAELAAARFADASAIYSSTLERARRTAERIAQSLRLGLELEHDLREYCLGEWEGKSYRELFDVHRLWHHMRSDPDYAPHGGESPRQVSDRFTAAVRRIAARHPGERVLVVAHGGALSIALGAILDGDFTNWKRVMDNCAVTELALEPAPELLSFNVTEHLEGI